MKIIYLSILGYRNIAMAAWHVSNASVSLRRCTFGVHCAVISTAFEAAIDKPICLVGRFSVLGVKICDLKQIEMIG